MTSTNLSFKKIAVLIDGDNTSIRNIDSILTKITALGTIGCKKIYGDFKQGNLSNWDDISLKFLLEQVHIPAYVKGKNATDIALAIDAIDLSYLDYDCFCIVSSDSDFSILAKNLRTKHKKVYGFGKATTIESFRMACDEYIIVDCTQPLETKICVSKTVLTSQTKQDLSKQRQTTDKTATKITDYPVPTSRLKQNTTLMNACRESIQKHLQNNGWADFCKVVNYLRANFPNISPKNYGYTTWRGLFNQIDIFAIENQKNGVFIRDKKFQVDAARQQNSLKNSIANDKLLEDIIDIINNNPVSIDGWMHIGQFGSQLKARGHDSKKYGHKTFAQLAANVDSLVVKKNVNSILVKIKK